MSIPRIHSLLFVVLLSACACPAQEKSPGKLILKVDENVIGPFGGQKSSSCLRVYSDGRVLYASWWNSAAIFTDKAGRESRPEHTVSVEHHLEDGDELVLSDLLESKALKRLPKKFDPPHRPIDYFERISVQIITTSGKVKQISTREFYVASLDEKARYPGALIVLMDKIDEIEHQANVKGKPIEIPSDCHLKAEER